MVNKAVVGIIVGLMFAAMAVGFVLGMVFAGGSGGQAAGAQAGPGGTPTAAEATPLPTTTTATAGPTTTAAQTTTAAPTPTPTATPTPTPEPRTTVLPRRFNETLIAETVRELVNERRASVGLDSLTGKGTVAEEVTAMARNYSERMADEGAVVHSLGGDSSADRYKQYGLFDTCRWEAADGDYILTAEYNRLEAIDKTYAGREYQENGETQFNANETAVARDIVEYWWSSPTYRQRLTWGNARRLGVGIEVTQAGSVYATANVC